MFFKKLVVALALTAGLAAEPAKNPLPNPFGYVDAGCVSFAVMHARADDVAFHKAMLTFWAELGKRQLDSSSWVGRLAITVSGWKGLQGLFWNRLLVDPQGNPWP